MPLDIDMTRPFGNPGMREDLVRAIERATKSNETRWLEWKGPLDLATKKGQFDLARQIIGFANRPVNCEAHRAGGHAYIVIGAEPGNIAGMPPSDLDLAVLEPRLKPLVGDGPSAPRWTAFAVPVNGKHVLVVDVDPPRWGDPIYVLRSKYETWEPGQVFVRHKASIDRPTAADMDALNDRVAGGSLHEVQIELIAAPGLGPLRPFRLDGEELEGLVRERQRAALASLERALRPPVQDVGGLRSVPSMQDLLARSSLSMMARLPDEPDTRTEAQYRAEVDGYVSACERALPEAALCNLYEHRLAEVSLVATNVTQRPLAEVEIRVHFPGPVTSLKWNRVQEPARPWPFGQPRRQQDPFAERIIRPPGGWPAGGAGWPPAGTSPPRPVVTDGGSVDIKYPPVTLRAETPLKLDGVSLLVDPDVGPTLVGEWSATSTVASGVARGTVEVAVGAAVTLQELLSLPPRRR